MEVFFVMLIIVVIYGVADIVWSSRLAVKAERLDEREEKLNDQEELLKERFLVSAREECDYEIVQSSYVVTDADEMKYNSDEAIFKVARRRIAANIAGDIVHTVDPIESVTEGGKKVYIYRFKIKVA